MLIGAFDPAAWDGLVFCDRPGHGFGLRFAVERDGERAELYDLLHIVHEVGPCAPDASYARVSFDTHMPLGTGRDAPPILKSGRQPGLTIEWGVVAQHTTVSRIHVQYDGVLEVHGYFPWDWQGTWSTQPTEKAGTYRLSGYTADGESELDVHVLHVSHSEAGGDRDEVVGSDDAVLLRLEVGSSDRIYLLASPQQSPTYRHQSPELAPGEIDRILARAAGAYEAARVRVDGHWDGLAAAITNNLHWMVSVKPESGRRYTPAGRRWIFPAHGGGRDHWTVFCWDAFFNGIELALESPDLARESILAVLETQYDNGNIPNWRGRFAGTPDRSQPPVGSFAVLKCYLRTGDRNLLERAFPYLTRWSEWWSTPKRSGRRRDGNGNGLFEWGCDVDLLSDSPASWENTASKHQLAAWESGQDDLPNWDDATWMDGSETFDVDSIDLNSLIALDLECLAQIARELGLERQCTDLRTEYLNLVKRVNRELWDDSSGMYVDRRWDGTLSPRLAASNFYPLVAGIPTPERARRMVETLLDQAKFWGRYVIPTISRDDPAFEDQQYWRGTIWPPPNYLICQGLRRYGFDEVAGELAARSAELFLRSWRDFQLCRENYDSRTGEGGGQAYQSWGPLFALVAVEEFIDINPWDGLRIGSLAPPPATTIRNLGLRGRQWDVHLSGEQLTAWVDQRQLLSADGPIVLRHVACHRNRFAADTLSLEPRTLSVSLESTGARALLDAKDIGPIADALHIPAGRHRLEVRGT